MIPSNRSRAVLLTCFFVCYPQRSMPYTLSHLAAALPLRKTKLSFVALLIGCLAPDLSYLFLPIFKPEGHSLLSLLYLSLPSVLILYFWYHRRGANFFCEIFPWIPQTQNHSFGIVCVSGLIGAFTHIAWDSFTHQTGQAVQLLPWLEQSAFFSLPVYKWLQYLSSVFGLIVVLAAIARQSAVLNCGVLKTGRDLNQYLALSIGLFIAFNYLLGWSIAYFYVLNRAFFTTLLAAIVLSFKTKKALT